MLKMIINNKEYEVKNCNRSINFSDKDNSTTINVIFSNEIASSDTKIAEIKEEVKNNKTDILVKNSVKTLMTISNDFIAEQITQQIDGEGNYFAYVYFKKTEK